jgi:hypothetical protein
VLRGVGERRGGMMLRFVPLGLLWRVRYRGFRWEWRDAWVGVFWDHAEPWTRADGSEYRPLEVYVCPLPFCRFKWMVFWW